MSETPILPTDATGLIYYYAVQGYSVEILFSVTTTTKPGAFLARYTLRAYTQDHEEQIDLAWGPGASHRLNLLLQ